MSDLDTPTGHEPQLSVGCWFWVGGIPFKIVELSNFYNKPPKLVAMSSSELLVIEKEKADA